MTPDRSPALRYLRVSLLTACNLNCSYCRPTGESGPCLTAPTEKLCLAVESLIRAGIGKVRFTGGEPTLHKDLAAIVARVKAIDSNVHSAITTNGVRLEDRAASLASAGLDSANVSLDTLDAKTFLSVTGHNQLDEVIRGIDTATKFIKQVKLNCVLMRGINDGEVPDLIRFADERGLDIRFIEYMPNRSSAPGDSRFIASDEIRARLPWNLKPIPVHPASPARYWTASGLKIRIGFISPVSHPFCNRCDRLRLTADGRLYACLFGSSSINLFEVMSSGTHTIEAELAKLVALKRFRGCRDVADRPGDLPSFSALGG